jgi:hypothetical protein
MEKATNNNYPSTLDEFIDDMQLHPDKYKYLQFIFSREKHHRLGMGQRYLLVNRVGFGLYQLDMVDYNNGIIQMIFTNADTGNPAEINLDVNNEHPELFLINWKDIEDMVYVRRTFDCAEDESLKLDMSNHEQQIVH